MDESTPDAGSSAPDAKGSPVEPPISVTDARALLLAFIDGYRATAARKVSGLSDAQVRQSVLPSGWTPLELLNHLAFMERRWLQWGFAGEAVPAPWGDDDPATGRWAVPPHESRGEVIDRLATVGARTADVVATADLGAPAAGGGRFRADDMRPTLNWILLHVLQEYARHVGQLDVVRELIDGSVGE
jgi:uncharacterized damage-inducible protein DinB